MCIETSGFVPHFRDTTPWGFHTWRNVLTAPGCSAGLFNWGPFKDDGLILDHLTLKDMGKCDYHEFTYYYIYIYTYVYVQQSI